MAKKIKEPEDAPIISVEVIEKKQRVFKEKQARIMAVISCILKGMTNRDIIQYYEGWGVTERTFYTYFSLAHEEIQRAHNVNREYEIANAKFRLNDLYSRCYAEMDYKTCLNVQSKIIDLFGLAVDSRLEQAFEKLEQLEKQSLIDTSVKRHIVQVYSDNPGTEAENV